MKLWRCDVCYQLIDPADGDERTVLSLQLTTPEGDDGEALDLCEDCQPSDLGGFVDWMVYEMEQDGGPS